MAQQSAQAAQATQKVSLPTLAAIHSNPQAGRQLKEASLSFMFTGNGSYRAPTRAWRTAIWFATGQKLATKEEAFYMDWNGQEVEVSNEE